LGLFGVLIFKLEEEENTTLLLHLPTLFTEAPVFVSASGLGCLLVVAFAQGLLAEQGFFLNLLLSFSVGAMLLPVF
jgi:hypothetical protein